MTSKIELFMKGFMSDHKYTIAAIASKTNRSNAFIHGIIHGYKSMDDDQIDKFARDLEMTPRETKLFKEAMYASKPNLIFNMRNLNLEQAEALAKVKCMILDKDSKVWTLLAKLNSAD